MKELLNKVGIGEAPVDATPAWKTQAEAEDALIIGREVTNMMNSEHQHDADHEQKMKVVDGMICKVETVEKSAEPPVVPSYSVPTVAQKTIISAGTTIFGDMRAEGDIEVSGKVKGNLETTENIRVYGEVLGDLKGNTVELSACNIKGNITATGTMLVNSETMVVGDVFVDTLITDGKIKGNVQAEKTASFQQNAVLLGNVTASFVNTSEGASVQGTIYISENGGTSNSLTSI
ncbi:MAG: polymer-forming cytoskeletal protein [Oscillospiraceae bacterium]